MIIPYTELSESALHGLLESFVTREIAVSDLSGSVESKVAQVKRLLEQGRAVILYEPREQSFTIVFKEDVPPDEERPEV